MAVSKPEVPERRAEIQRLLGFVLFECPGQRCTQVPVIRFETIEPDSGRGALADLAPRPLREPEVVRGVIASQLPFVCG
jgi:hypothetical protein